MFENRSKVVFASAILGVLYFIMLFKNFFLGIDDVGSAVATALVMPHIIAVLIAMIFNILGFLKNKKAFVIVALVMYCVAGVLFILYVIMLIPMIILSAIGISKVSKINKVKEENNK